MTYRVSFGFRTQPKPSRCWPLPALLHPIGPFLASFLRREVDQGQKKTLQPPTLGGPELQSCAVFSAKCASRITQEKDKLISIEMSRRLCDPPTESTESIISDYSCDCHYRILIFRRSTLVRRWSRTF